MLLHELKQAIIIDLEFAKPNVKSTIVKIESDGFHYSIGHKGNTKKVPYEVFDQCYHQLQTDGEFSRKWFNSKFPKIAKAAPCNFTTIGGLFQHFKLATYEKSTYIKKMDV